MINFDGMIVSNDVIEVKQLKISPFALKSIVHSMNFCNFCFGYDLNMTKNMTIFSLPMIIPVFLMVNYQMLSRMISSCIN